MRQEVNTLSKGRGLPQQLREQLCPHPNKEASLSLKQACIVCHMLGVGFSSWLGGDGGCRFSPVGSDSAGCLETSACSTSLNWFCKY